MRKRIQAWLRGPIIAIGSMALYAIALGCFLALMLLVISMEEGGENLSSSTLDMTRIVVLLSQGIGFETDSLSLSIMPLLLTVLLIGLVWSFSRKICTDIRAYVSGVVVWIFINVMGTQSPYGYGMPAACMPRTILPGTRLRLLSWWGTSCRAAALTPTRSAPMQGFNLMEKRRFPA